MSQDRMSSLATLSRPPSQQTPNSITIFRPRAIMVATLLVIPVIVLLYGLAFALYERYSPATLHIIITLSGGVVIGWFLSVIIFASTFLSTVEVNSDAILVMNLWQRNPARAVRFQWSLIEWVDRKFGFLRIRSSNGKSLLIYHHGLANDDQFLRQIALRVAPSTLSGIFKDELMVLTGDIFSDTANTNVPQLTIDRSWSVLAVFIALIGTGLAFEGTLIHSAPFLIGGAVLGFCGVLSILLFRQVIYITSTSFTVKHRLLAPSKTVLWSDVNLLKTHPLDFLQRLHGSRHSLFLGAFFMSSLHRNILRSALSIHNIVQYQTWWIF